MSLKPELLKLSEVLGKDISIDKTGKVTFADGLYEKALAEVGSNLEEAKRVNTANVTIATAIGHAGGHKAIDVMKSNKSVDRVVGIMKQGGAEFKFDLKRESTNRNPANGEVSTVHGALNIGIVLKGLKGGQATAVKAELKDLGAKHFAK